MFQPDKLSDLIAKPVADPFSLESLIGWLEKQPPDESYDYGCNGHCLIAQYFDAAQVSYLRVAGDYYRTPQNSLIPLPAHFNNIAVNNQWTFGAALSRARALAETR